MDDFILIYDLIAKSLLKIALVLGGMLMVFLTFPITRTSRLFAAGLIGSFTGGIIIQMASDEYNLAMLTACSVALGLGIALLPLLNVLGRLNQRLSEDDAVIDELYSWLKFSIKNRAQKLIPAKEKVDKETKS